MTLQYRFTYLACQSCTAKIHCEKCQEDILSILMNLPGVTGGEVNIPQGVLLVHSDGADPDEIDDEMDAIGVFLS